MERRAFESTLNDYRDHLLTATQAFLVSRGLSFSKADFEEDASIKFDDLARDVLFFGAQVFPDDSLVHDHATMAA